MAGQQQALSHVQPPPQQQLVRGPSVTMLGEVKNSLVPWTSDLSLGKAILAAEYQGEGEPSEVVITRNGDKIPVDTTQLLKGQDIQLEPWDMIQIK